MVSVYRGLSLKVERLLVQAATVGARISAVLCDCLSLADVEYASGLQRSLGLEAHSASALAPK